MSGFIDRLAEFLRDILGSDGSTSEGRDTRANQRYVDPDLQEAWDELDDYMKGGSEADTARERAGRSGGQRPRHAPDDSLRQDYANLEVPFGADMETVRRSYKALMLRYHPDRNSGNPEKQRVALEITKKINESFERIRSDSGRRTPSS